MDLSQYSTEELQGMLEPARPSSGGDLSQYSTEELQSMLQAEEPTSGIEDIIRSGISGVARGLPHLIDLAGAGLAYGYGKLTDQPIDFQEALAVAPASKIASKLYGEEYQPQTYAGEMAKWGGEAVGTLPLGGSGALTRQVVGRTALGGALAKPSSDVGGEVGEAVGGETGRTVGEIAGGITGGATGFKYAPEAMTKTGKVLAQDVSKIAGGVKDVATAGKRIVKGADADKVFSEIIARSNKTPEQIAKELESGKISTIADIGGDEIQGITRAIGRTEGGRNIIADALTGRSEKAVERVTKELQKNISNVDTYFGNLDDVAKMRSQSAIGLYEKAYAEAPNIKNPELNKFLADQRIIDATNRAKKSYGVRLEASSRSLETLDGVKKVLYDDASAARNAGRSVEAGALDSLRKDLVSVLDKSSKTYSEARKTFAGFSALEEAQVKGLAFTKMTPEQLSIELKGMTAGEKEAFRIGVRESLQKTVYGTADGADPAKRIFGNTMKQKQLKAIFPTDAHYTEFAKRIREEINAANTKFKVLGGSRTDFNIQSDAAFIDAAANAAQQGMLRTTIDKAVTAMADALKRRYVGLTPKNSQEIAKILTDRKAGIQAIDKLIKSQKDIAQKELIKKSFLDRNLPWLGGQSLRETLGSQRGSLKVGDEFEDVLHGTTEKFTEFDPKKVGSRFGYNEAGIIFTDSPRTARYYSMTDKELDDIAFRMSKEGKSIADARVIKAQIKKMKNPIDKKVLMSHPRFKKANEYHDPIDMYDDHRDIINEMLATGKYDGVKINHRGETIYAVQDPKNIKIKGNK